MTMLLDRRRLLAGLRPLARQSVRWRWAAATASPEATAFSACSGRPKG